MYRHVIYLFHNFKTKLSVQPILAVKEAGLRVTVLTRTFRGAADPYAWVKKWLKLLRYGSVRVATLSVGDFGPNVIKCKWHLDQMPLSEIHGLVSHWLKENLVKCHTAIHYIPINKGATIFFFLKRTHCIEYSKNKTNLHVTSDWFYE